MVILDTSVLIDYLRRPTKVDSPLEEFIRLYQKDQLAISQLTIQELYSGKSSREVVKEQFFLKLVDFLEILPYSYEIAKLAGEITRDLKRPIGFPDAAIAATTIFYGGKLLTLNKKDFASINRLDII